MFENLYFLFISDKLGNNFWNNLTKILFKDREKFHCRGIWNRWLLHPNLLVNLLQIAGQWIFSR